MKKCFKCNESKPIDEFYKHSAMADGYLNKCKNCNKSDSIKNRLKNVDYYRDYDIKRGIRFGSVERTREWRNRYPKKYKAQAMVQNYVRSGKLIKLPCEVCGKEKVHAHHDNYDFPLNVRWLCVAHHKSWHDEYGEGANGI